ncbi:hypothetical protein M407DRAFT_25911 [Tulasnella calospora MUT 4182]|uniref:HSF-type DNA-binding domain-containing protein n=1 Tax=Tulasnella calospora MUT 4182 TaxID=1051891 RepID=A0A0C3KT55_9AGAM|nr:hypothetical protein M407DRAFT_25911 [Tulasnella calospora MUT 4182]
MNTQSQQLAYVAPSSYMTQNGSHASLLDDMMTRSSNVYEESQLYYQKSGQDDPTSTHAINLHTSSPSTQSPETRVQPAVSSFGKINGQKDFVRKLYDMLSDESAKPYIYWCTDGKSFTIENQEVFAKNVLKRYLKTENVRCFALLHL